MHQNRPLIVASDSSCGQSEFFNAITVDRRNSQIVYAGELIAIGSIWESPCFCSSGCKNHWDELSKDLRLKNRACVNIGECPKGKAIGSAHK
jgi:hypothetical protein